MTLARRRRTRTVQLVARATTGTGRTATRTIHILIGPKHRLEPNRRPRGRHAR